MFENKLKELEKHIKKLKRISIGFSGGKDSLFLTLISIRSIGNNNVLPVFIDLEYINENIRERVKYFSEKYEINLIKSYININNNYDILYNTEKRCYWCKRLMYEKILKISKENKFYNIADGTNFSDLKKHRPGLIALKELNILKPLVDFEISDKEIYDYLKNKERIDDNYLSSTTCNLINLPNNKKWK